jgi:hypothetical protein
MQILGCSMLAFVVLAFLIAYSFGGLVFLQNRIRTSADEIALAGARKLNDQDRIGQMNNMIARSRQLVFSSREELDKTTSDYPQLQSLAQQFLDETRDSAQQLELQRKALHNVAISEAQTAMQNKFDQIKGTYPMALPWMNIGLAEMPSVKIGKIVGTESNVAELKNIKDLEDNDHVKSLVSSDPGLKLYHESTDLKLPGSDSDLSFKVSPLDAPVEKSVAPARIALFDKYQPSKDDHLPSATQVTLKVKVATGLGPHAESTLAAIGTACATGASVQQ